MSTAFLNSLTSAVTQTAAPQAAGRIFVIRCVPDLYTGEVLNVGVCAISGASGKRVMKIVTEPGRLVCLYGEAASAIVRLAAVAGEAALRGEASPSPQIRFEEPAPFYNLDVEQMVEIAFRDQVTVALPMRAASQSEVIDDVEALDSVRDVMKLRAGFDTSIIANTPQVLIQTEKGPRAVNIPLQPVNGVGIVRSAYYSPATLKNHLLDSALDLEFAARYRSKGQMGLFVLRPPKRDKRTNGQIDAVIDSIAYRAPSNMTLEVGYSPEELADAVNTWGALAA